MKKRQKKYEKLLHEWHYRRVIGDPSANLYNKPNIEDVNVYSDFINYLSENVNVEMVLILFGIVVIFFCYPVIYAKKDKFLEELGYHGVF